MRAIAVLLLIRGCSSHPSADEVAHKIAGHAGQRADFIRTSSRFVDVLYKSVTRSECDELMNFARTFGEPPDCVAVRCNFADGSKQDFLTSYDDEWIQGPADFPRCIEAR